MSKLYLMKYDPEDPLSWDSILFWCNTHEQRSCVLTCPTCDRYPCSQITKDLQQALLRSPLMNRVVDLTKPLRMERIKTMYLAKMRDGSFMEIPDLDPNNPPTELLQGVEEVYVISKVLVPTITLRPKSKDERGEIKARGRAAVPAESETTAPAEAPTKRKRGPNKVK